MTLGRETNRGTDGQVGGQPMPRKRAVKTREIDPIVSFEFQNRT